MHELAQRVTWFCLQVRVVKKNKGARDQGFDYYAGHIGYSYAVHMSNFS